MTRLKLDYNSEEELNLLRKKINIIDNDSITLNQESKEVAVYVAGYIAHKMQNKFQGCCNYLLMGESCDNDRYVKLLSRGGLKIPSNQLSHYVCDAFAILDATIDIINDSGFTARNAAEFILKESLINTGFSCEKDAEKACRKINRIITNIFFNNKRKISTGSVVEDRIKTFKKFKLEKH